MPQATIRNAEQLKPEVIRNDMIETLTQLDYIQMGGETDGDTTYASAASEFPLVNMDDPDEAYYTHHIVAGRMQPTAHDAESPLGSINLPEKEVYTTDSYKEKIRPDKGLRSRFKRSPYSVAATITLKFQIKTWLTREQVTWRGDEVIDGLIGMEGQTKHPDLPDDHDVTVANPWSDSANAEPYRNITNAVARTVDNGVAGGNSAPVPNLYGSPGALRDLKQTADMEERVAGVRIKSLDTGTLEEIIDEELGEIRRVRVNIPRENANGEMIDEDGDVVDEAKNAAMDNALEPWDPDMNSGAGGNRRCVVIGRPGTGSAFMPWFLEDLLDYQEDVPPSGEMAVDDEMGFFTQRWSTNDPVGTTIKTGQEVGFHLMRPENWHVLRGI